MVEIEKFIPPSYADVLEDIICKNPEFAWTYTPSTNNQTEAQLMKRDASSYESEQLVHALYLEGGKRSQFFDVVFPFFYFLEEKTGLKLAAIERIKANMLLRSAAKAAKEDRKKDGKNGGKKEEVYNTPHVDIPTEGYKSLIYYVKDSDGDTFLFKERFGEEQGLTVAKRVTPRKGKAVIFDSNTWHASSNPRQNQNRIVVNFIFQVKD